MAGASYKSLGIARPGDLGSGRGGVPGGSAVLRAGSNLKSLSGEPSGWCVTWPAWPPWPASSGYLDFGEVSVALADMGALDGVLASKAGELFEMFDVDGDGRVDVDEFEELTAKAAELTAEIKALKAEVVREFLMGDHSKGGVFS